MPNPRAIRNTNGAVLLAVILAACARQVPTADDSSTPAHEPAAAAPAAETGPADSTNPEPAAAPPNEPSTTPPAHPPAASLGPDLNSMQLARPSAKLGVAADVRYQLEPLAPGQSATLHLAVVPRIAGAPMQVSLKENTGLIVAAGPSSVQKLGARDVQRKQYAVTRAAASATQIRVLVTMDVAEGTSFGFFTIPLEGAAPARKLDSVKQR